MTFINIAPTFAVLIAPFAILPDIPGLILWNVLNCIVVFLGIWKFPNFSSKAKVLCFWFVVHELLLATQSSQSNALIAGLIILAYHQMEKKNVHWASLLLVIGFFIKPFVLVAFAMWLFFDKKWQFIAYTIGWGILLALSPLIFVSYDQFIFLYKSWLNLLANDHSVSYGLSLMGMLKAVFDLDAKLYILGIGAVLFCIPMMRIHQYKSLLFRQLFLASILIWIIIFNHRAESQTFIIAICGVAIWYFSQPYKPFNLVLLIFCLYITQLTSSEVFFPQSIRRSFIDLYEIKALPCIIIWFLVLYDLTFKKFQDYALKL